MQDNSLHPLSCTAPDALVADKTYQQAYQMALALLAQREYSAYALGQKLQQKGVNQALIQPLISQLQQQNYQSDARFLESYVRGHLALRQGELKIHYALKQQQLNADDIAVILDEYADSFLENACYLVRKKASAQALRKDFALKNKIMRSLANKGYAFTTIKSAIDKVSKGEDD